MRFLLTIASIIALLSLSGGQLFSSGHALENAETAQLQDGKPIVVFVRAEWCKYCRLMEMNVFKDSTVQMLLEEKAHFAMLDAQTREDIRFNGEVFTFRPSGPGTGTHELAIALGEVDGALSFPTLSVLNSRKELVFQGSGYLSVEQFVAVLEAL